MVAYNNINQNKKKMKNNNTSNPIVPCKLYLNPDKDKIQILKDNKKKSGVYI